MRARIVGALMATAMIVFGGAAAAVATEPVALGASRVLDQSDVLTAAQETELDTQLRELPTTSGVDLWVVYVPEFTDPTDPEGWATATAERNGLGPHQYLLAISTEGQQFYLSGDSSGPVSGAQLDAIEQQRIQPALASGDWMGAATAAATGLTAVVGGGGTPGSSGGASIFPALLIVVVIALAALVIWIVIRSRRKSQPAVAGGGAQDVDPVSQISTEDLARQAASALVQTDDAIKTSEQELGFARAQFGDAASAEFDEALAHAKTDLDQAFALKQQLDDEAPDTEAQARQWHAQIIDLCTHANAELDEKAAAFDELRKLEQNAPEALARVHDARAAVVAGQASAAATLAHLQLSYAPQALAPIIDNPSQAEARLTFAEECLANAEREIGAGNGGAAAVSIRAAEEAVGQATQLHAAIDKLGGDLAQGERDAATLVAELEKDIALASGLPDPDGRLGAVISSTRQQVDAATALLAGPAKRPLFALESLDKANQEIDAVLTGIRDAQAQAQRAAQQLGSLISQAQGQVSAAEDYITSRRGAIGAEARTRLAEAGSSLVQAKQLAPTDPAAALPYAQRANDLAAQAIQYAQNDVGSFQGGAMSGGGGNNGGGNGNMMGAILGGIVINSLLGGGGGGRSSGNRGSSGGFGGGFGGGSGGRSSGSFGGGGTRSRRGGGRF